MGNHGFQLGTAYIAHSSNILKIAQALSIIQLKPFFLKKISQMEIAGNLYIYVQELSEKLCLVTGL